MIKGYSVKRKLTSSEDKSIYLVESGNGDLRVLKVFEKTYKQPIYEKLSALHHKNMPTIHEVILDEDCFYVLEDYIEGRTLQDFLDTDGAFGKKAVVEIASQLCDILFYLHNQLAPIVHRDIKPDNIILTKDGIVKLIDFDIAREHKKEAAKDTEIVGTKPYAPPEQYGFVQSDHRTDIHSLGMLMTVLLTNTFEVSMIQSRRVRKIVGRCTAFDPRRRYADARVLKNMLRLCVSAEELPCSIFRLDAFMYVFPHSKLRIQRVVASIAVFYIAILFFAFAEPYTRRPRVSILWGTVTVNPQWTANSEQLLIYEVIEILLIFSFIAFIAFAVYDIFMFYHYKFQQRRFLKKGDLSSSIVPFVIASKIYLYCVLVIVLYWSAILIFDTSTWANDAFTALAAIVAILSCLLSFAFRGVRHPRHYNSAVRHYYRGRVEKATKIAQRVARHKRTSVKMWLAGVLNGENRENCP